MLKILKESDQVRMSVSDVRKLYQGHFIFATNFENDTAACIDYCIPRIVCSSVQILKEEHIKEFKLDELAYGNLAYLDYTVKPDLLFF